MGAALEQKIDAIRGALNAAGLAVVPIEPTKEMLHAMTMEPPTWDDEASRRKWKAALSAINQTI